MVAFSMDGRETDWKKERKGDKFKEGRHGETIAVNLHLIIAILFTFNIIWTMVNHSASLRRGHVYIIVSREERDSNNILISQQ